MCNSVSDEAIINDIKVAILVLLEVNVQSQIPRLHSVRDIVAILVLLEVNVQYWTWSWMHIFSLCRNPCFTRSKCAILGFSGSNAKTYLSRNPCFTRSKCAIYS